MNLFVKKCSDIVKGVLTGFDRIVFKGSGLPRMSAKNVEGFCASRGVLNKDYKRWMTTRSWLIAEDASNHATAHSGRGIVPIASSSIRKESLARMRQEKAGIASGLIGVWSAVESCSSYKARYCAEPGFPRLKREWCKCKHLYFYFDHEEFGFMNVRLRTWFSYHIQIAFNGREWLRRDLTRAGCAFVAKGNKLLEVEDFDLAQRLLDSQLDTRWEQMLNGFLPVVFPAMRGILGPHLSYYWTLWQSEWAVDLN